MMHMPSTRLAGKVRAALLSTIALGAIASAGPALADINTLPDWNGTSFISSWGLPNTATYGQTFVASNTQARFSSFTFELAQSSGATQPQYQAFVYAWDTVNSRLTGSALFTSAVLTAPATGSPTTYVPVSVNMGTPLVLTPGQTYVVLFTTSSVSQPAVGNSYRWGALTNNTDIPNGQFVFMNNGTNFAQLSTNTWSFIGEDLALNFVLAPLSLNSLLSGAPVNAVNVATGFDNSVNAGNVPPAGFQALYSLSGAALNNALLQIDGEVGSVLADSARSTLNPFLNNMTSRFANMGASLHDATIASATPGVLPAELEIGAGHAWLSVSGSEGHSHGDPLTIGSHSLLSHTVGIQGGVDFLVGDNAAAGLSLGHSEADFRLNSGLGTSRSSAFEVGAYGTVRFMERAYLSGAFGFATHDFDTRRIVTVLGTDDLQASFSADNFGGRVEGGYRFTADAWGITPYGALTYQEIDLPGYTEHAVSGSSTFALTYAARSPSDLRTELGATFDRDFTDGEWRYHVFDRMAWVYDDADKNLALAAFGSMPGSAFTVFGAKTMGSGGLISLGAQATSWDHVAVSAEFDSLLSDRATNVGGQLKVSYTW